MQSEPSAHTPDTWPRPRPFIVITLLTLYAAGLMRDIDLPWVGMHDWNGAYYGYISRNMLRYPFALSRGLPVVEMGPPAEGLTRVQLYATHPPGLPWMLAACYALLGESEAVARMIPILFSLASLWLLLRIVSGTLGRPIAMLAGLFYAVMPAATFFGRMVDQEAIVTGCMLLSLWGWLGLHGEVATGRSPRLRRAAWLIGLIGAMLADWPGYLFAGVMFVDALRRGVRTRGGAGRVIVAGIVPLVVAVIVLCWLVFGGLDGSWAALRDMMLSRSPVTAESAPRKDISAPGAQGRYTLENVSLGILALAAAGGLIVMARSLRRGKRPAAGAAGGRVEHWSAFWILTIVGGLWLGLFWPQYERHNYWLYYLLPSIAICAAAGAARLHELLRRDAPPRADVIAGVVVFASVGLGLWGANDYFSRRSFPIENVRVLRAITAALGPDETVVSFAPIADTDRRGAYVYRNLVPPHFVYYLDRRAVFADQPDEIERLAAECAILLVPANRMEAARPILDRLAQRYPVYVNHPYFIVDFNPHSHRGGFGDRVAGPPGNRP